jgi:hypothetical protein
MKVRIGFFISLNFCWFCGLVDTRLPFFTLLRVSIHADKQLDLINKMANQLDDKAEEFLKTRLDALKDRSDTVNETHGVSQSVVSTAVLVDNTTTSPATVMATVSMSTDPSQNTTLIAALVDEAEGIH